MSLNPAPIATSTAVNHVSSGADQTAETFSLNPLGEIADQLATHPGEDAADDAASTDVLVQLRSNLSQLEELHGRLQFVMAEVSYIIKP